MWPKAEPVDEILIKSSAYLMEAAHSFRIYIRNQCAPKKGKKGQANAPPPEKPTEATVWIAKSYPPWQSIVLTTLKEFYDVSNIK